MSASSVTNQGHELIINVPPDDMILRRAAFDFLQSKNIISQQDTFNVERADAHITDIRVQLLDGRSNVRARKICFDDGERVIFDDSYTVISYEDSDCMVIVNDQDSREKLNLAKQMASVAFPVLRPEKEASERPEKRPKLEDQPDMFGMIPTECTLRVISFASSMQDILPMMRVCRQWRQLLSGNEMADEIIWKPLSLHYYPVLEKVHEARENTSIAWQDIFLERARHLKARFRPSQNEIKARDRFDHGKEEESFEPLPFQAYENSFYIVFWDENGASTKVKVKPELYFSGMIQLNLPKELPDFMSYEVCIQHSDEPSPRILYSGTEFEPFNRFEMFRAKSFFVSLTRPEDVDPDGIARIAIPSVTPLFVTGFSSHGALMLKLSWQVDNEGSSFVSMSRQDILIFLQKGMTAAPTERSSHDDASNPPVNWAMPDFSPRPLSSYGFIIDVRHAVNDTLPSSSSIASRYYESNQVFKKTDDGVILKLDLPSEYQEMIQFIIDEKSVEISVHVVDRRTGQLAVLYDGSNIGDGWQQGDEVGEIFNAMEANADFELFDASTFFSIGQPMSSYYGSVPMISGMLCRSEDDASPVSLKLNLYWAYRNANFARSHIVIPVGEGEAITLLEKGLAWRNL